MTKLLSLCAAVTLVAAPAVSFACDTCGCKDAKHEAAHSEGAEHLHDIVDTAVEADGFNTLVAAVKAGGLVETLKGDGPFTVFAPTDEAFAKIDSATLDSLLKPENKDQLVAILTYHVVPGKVMAADAVGLVGQSAETVNGAKAAIAKDGDDLTIAGSKIIATDIECTNGVIHVIDTVMMP
ncbi:MAG: fasciclin domain-containing protein [Planctomycetota bacterium]